MPEQVGVDATRIDLEVLLHARRAFSVEHLGTLAQVDGAHESIDFQHTGPGHLGKSALGHQPQADHLAQAIRSVDVAQAEQRIVEGRGFDQRHAHGIAPDADALGQPGQRLHTLLGRQTVGIATVQIGLAAAQADGSEGGAENQANQR